jgi:hypothetical protein
MAIDRAPWNALVDDDGSNLVGSIWNKAAIKTVILDPVDAALVVTPPPVVSWTPVDVSGAGLVLASWEGKYQKIGNHVEVWGRVQYPTTADATSAQIGGLPFANGAFYVGLYITHGAVPSVLHLPPGATAFYVVNNATGTSRPNSQLSAASLIFQGSYLTDY